MTKNAIRDYDIALVGALLRLAVADESGDTSLTSFQITSEYGSLILEQDNTPPALRAKDPATPTFRCDWLARADLTSCDPCNYLELVEIPLNRACDALTGKDRWDGEKWSTPAPEEAAPAFDQPPVSENPSAGFLLDIRPSK